MTLDRFNTIVTDQIEHCRAVLKEKGAEYVFSADRLDHFKNSAEEQGIGPKQALWGMTSKHHSSLAGMCKSDGDYPPEVWREKITDAMNYLLLLWALIREEAESDV